MTSINYFSSPLSVDSTVLTPPSPVSHHYIKRSSQLYSPQPTLPQPRSIISSNSASSCCTTSTINSLKPLPSPSHFTHLKLTENQSAPLDASAVFHPINPPTAASHTSSIHPANNMLPSAHFSRRLIAPSQRTDLSHLPIHPVVVNSNPAHSAQNIPPTYTLNLPSPQIYLEQAMKTEVVDRFGRSVQFENLIDLDYKTVVIFIRHFRCGYSQRYIRRLSQIANGEIQVNQKKLQKGVQEDIKFKHPPSKLNQGDSQTDNLENWISANGVKVIVIGNGDYHLIESYKKILDCPFPIYTDLSEGQKVYKLLGMNKVKDLKLQGCDSTHPDPLLLSLSSKKSKIRAVKGPLQRHNEPLIRKGESKLAFLSQVLYNAWRMPWKWSGDPQQLGGEIIFEPIREEKRIKRKPIKHKLVHDLLTKSNSIRSNSSLATTATTIEGSDGNNRSTPFRRPSCSIRNGNRAVRNSNFLRNLNLLQNSAKEIQIQCKFIHQMTSFTDHFSIDELMMQSGIRLTSLIQKY